MSTTDASETRASTRRLHGKLCMLVLVGCAGAALVRAAPQAPAAGAPPSASAAPQRFVETLPGTRLALTMVRVPETKDAQGAQLGGFWIATTEVPWEAYDVLVFGLDDPALARPGDADAFSRPSKPYVAMDRGFGHDGRPAISLSLAGAQAFCAFLSERTGRRWRLPSEREWELAARAGASGRWCSGDDPSALDAVAWYRANASRGTQPVGTKAPNALGLFDVHGNAAEWCLAGEGADPTQGVLKGGSYQDPPEALAFEAEKRPSSAWNASDPQLPKSRWWLADAPFAGFRVVCDAPPRGE